MKKLTVLTLFSLAAVLQLCAAAPVWKISRGDSHVYLGGTIHLLSKEDYPLPQAFDRAYSQSAKVVFEIDIEQAKTPQFAQKLLLGNMYAGDDDLTKHLKPETVKKLEAFLQGKNMTLDALKKMKPGFLTIMLATVEMQRIGMVESGVDQFYCDKASADGKRKGALETIDEQLAFISRLGEGMEDELILHSIEEMDQIEEMMGRMKRAWRKGDLNALAEVALADWKDEFPAVYQEIMVDRNNNWMPQIKKLFETRESEFVLVGALHLAGEDGLLAMLKKEGYQVLQMD
jgi:uncharacterized protein